ncbi:hypothetical protein [Cohnella soli]|uniref:Uncharacterized protein n=1 Tax=Cohnella soli TaxID=425005 RepID=A0ABW0HQA6_9BACL
MSKVVWSPELREEVKKAKKGASQLGSVKLLPHEKKAVEDVLRDKADNVISPQGVWF